MFDWTMNDGTRSGNAVLGQRLKKFKKIIVTEEKEIEHQIAEWSKANSQIRQLAAELVSQDGLGHVVAEQTSRTTPIGEQRQQKDAASEVEAEKARLKMQIEKESISSARVMRESEKVSLHISHLLRLNNDDNSLIAVEIEAKSDGAIFVCNVSGR